MEPTGESVAAAATAAEATAHVDEIDRRSAHNVKRSADLLRRVDRLINERRAHLSAIDDSLRRVRALTDAVELGPQPG